MQNFWGDGFPAEAKRLILEPILLAITHEVEDACITDCTRVLGDPSTLTEDEAKIFWKRFDRTGSYKPKDQERVLRIESFSSPCKVGFEVGKQKSCPIFAMDRPQDNIPEALKIISEITKFRVQQKK